MDAFFHLFPTTLAGWLIELVVSLVVSLAAVSFGELLYHAFFMHQRLLPTWSYRVFPGLERTVYEHQDLHHNTYFAQFNYEPSEVGRRINMYIRHHTTWSGIIVMTPVFLVGGLLFGTLVPAIVFPICMLLHQCAWNILHPEMHNPKRPAWTKWTIYKYLARYHYLHHYLHKKGIGMNFNIVLPGADFVFGRSARVLDEQNIKEIQEYGYWY